jgi:hypothetical protein
VYSLNDAAERRRFVRCSDARPWLDLDTALVQRLREAIGPYRAVDERDQIRLVLELLTTAGVALKRQRDPMTVVP